MPKKGLAPSPKTVDTVLKQVRQYNHEIDRIEIVPEIRWKESGASGDEYRYGIKINFYCKGKVVKSEYKNQAWFPTLEAGTANVHRFYKELEEPDDEEIARREPLCDHWSCSKPGILFRMKKKHDTYDDDPDDTEVWTRRYCDEHRDRGDCAIVDCTENYVPIPNDQEPTTLKTWTQEHLPLSHAVLTDLRKELTNQTSNKP